MKLLLDTHSLLWALEGNPRLSAAATALLDDANNELFVSAVSAYEIALKFAAGKLPGAAPLATAFEECIAPMNCFKLPISIAHAVGAGRLDLAHRDPFDRLLAAQALIEQIPIISNDRAFDVFGVERLW